MHPRDLYFRDYLRVLRRGWPAIVLATLLGVAVASAYLSVAPKVYTATSSILVSAQGSEDIAQLQQGNDFSAQVVRTYAEIAKSPTVLQPVVDELGLPGDADDLSANLSISVVGETSVLEITSRDSDPQRAADIANAVAASSMEVIADLGAPADPGAAPLVRLDQIREAAVPRAAVSPNERITLVLGVVVGLVIGLALALLLNALDRRVRGTRDLWPLAERSLLARIPHRRGLRRQPLAVRDDPGGRVGEAYRTLRTNLRFLEPAGARSFAIAGSTTDEGSTGVAVNVAWSLAEAGSRVALVDTDLRTPGVGPMLGLPVTAGLSDLLAGDAEFSEVVQPGGHPRLTVVPTGSRRSDSSDLLSGDRMRDLTRWLEERYDYVILDTAPLLSSTDAVVIAALSTGTVFTVASGRTTRQQLASALVALSNVGVSPAGFVLTRARAGDADPYPRTAQAPRAADQDALTPPRRASGVSGATPASPTALGAGAAGPVGVAP